MCGYFHFTATAMQVITKNFKLGFGSFVDKAVSPFVRTEYGYITAVKCILTKLTTSIKGILGFSLRNPCFLSTQAHCSIPNTVVLSYEFISSPLPTHLFPCTKYLNNAVKFIIKRQS